MLDKNLKRIREQKGYSKVKLGELSNVSKRTIERIENKNYRSTSIGIVEKLAKALEVSVIDLIK